MLFYGKELTQNYYTIQSFNGPKKKYLSLFSLQEKDKMLAFLTFPKQALVFTCLYSSSLLKTLWEKEKLLITSNFFFSHSVFNHFGELSYIFIKLKIVVCKLFQFGRV